MDSQPGQDVSVIAAALSENEVRSRPLGQGNFPDELDRFCWGAFFFPLLWALRRGVWWVLAVFVAQLAAGPALLRFLPRRTSSPVWFVFAIVYTLALSAFFLWLGVNGNRLAWKTAAKSEIARNGMTVGKVLNGEAIWIAFGIANELLFAGVMVWGITDGSVKAYQLSDYLIALTALGVAFYLSKSVGSAAWKRMVTSSI